jgi:hypothetical protein
MPNPALTIAFDGNYAAPMAIGAVRRDYDKRHFVTIYRQPWCVHADWWVASPFTDVCPVDAGARLIEETEPAEVSGTPLVTWEKVWCTFPPDRNESGTFNKTYKTILKQSTNGQLSALGMSSRTQMINVTIGYHYSRNFNSLSIPGVMDAQISSVGIFTWIDRYNGWPDNGLNNESNYTPHWLGGEITLWRGDIWEQKRIYG